MKPSRLMILLLLCSTGCNADDSAGATDLPDPPVTVGTDFDAATAGRITGRVIWTGPIPNPPGFLYGVPRAGGFGFEFRTAENPNRPSIDTNSRAVAGVVVFLRGVTPATSHEWDHPPVEVEIGEGQIQVIQGGRRGRVGFVRRGDSITVTSVDSTYHVLRGRGDAFFGLPLTEPGRATTRALTRPGRVELSSGTGLYWARAHLFVADHPYFTVTDAEGRFTLDRVPAGPVELIAWLPGWQAARMERDPDSTQVMRQSYSPPIERATNVTVERALLTETSISLP